MWGTMDSTSNQKRAKDILNSQNFTEKIASFRIVNMRVGQGLTNLLGDKFPLSSYSATDSNNLSNDDLEMSVVRFIKCETISSGLSLIIIGNEKVIKVWRVGFIDRNKCISELLSEKRVHKSKQISYPRVIIADASIDNFSKETDLNKKNAFLLFNLYQSSGDTDAYQSHNPLSYKVQVVGIANINKIISERTYNLQLHSSKYNHPYHHSTLSSLPSTASSISMTSHVIVISQSCGYLHLLHKTSLELLIELQSIPGQPAVFAASIRWIAIQVPKSTWSVDLESDSTSESDSGGGSNGDTARRIVSGLYTMGKVGLAKVTPLWSGLCSNLSSIQQALKPYDNTNENKPTPHQSQQEHPRNNSLQADGESGVGEALSARLPAAQPQQVQGGVIVIYDTGSIASSSVTGKPGEAVLPATRDDAVSKTGRQPEPLMRFRAHRDDIATLAFSPSGLRIASASATGQVILIHALCTAGMLPSSPQLFANTDRNYGQGSTSLPLENDYMIPRPQLLYKLVRGLTLARVVDIKFDIFENFAYVATSSGTVHVFELEDQTASFHNGNNNSNSMNPSSTATSVGVRIQTGVSRSMKSVSSAASLSTCSSPSPSPPSTSHLHSELSSNSLNSGISNEKYIPMYGQSPSSWTAPTTDIAQLLQLHPHVQMNSRHSKYKQLSPDLRIRLPLRPLTSSSSSSKGNLNSIADLPTSLEVEEEENPNSNSHLHSGGNQDYLNVKIALFNYLEPLESQMKLTQRSSHLVKASDYDVELLTITTEGFLSRMRISQSPHTTTAAATTSNLSNSNNTSNLLLMQNLQSQPNLTSRELNRWDVKAEPGLVDGENSESLYFSSSTHMIASSNGSFQDRLSLSYAMKPSSSSSQSYPYNLSSRDVSGKSAASMYSLNCSWISSVAEFIEYPELPLYLRPKVRMHIISKDRDPADSHNENISHNRDVTGEANKNISKNQLCSFLLVENAKTNVIRVRRPGPQIPRSQTVSTSSSSDLLGKMESNKPPQDPSFVVRSRILDAITHEMVHDYTKNNSGIRQSSSNGIGGTTQQYHHHKAHSNDNLVFIPYQASDSINHNNNHHDNQSGWGDAWTMDMEVDWIVPVNGNSDHLDNNPEPILIFDSPNQFDDNADQMSLFDAIGSNQQQVPSETSINHAGFVETFESFLEQSPCLTSTQHIDCTMNKNCSSEQNMARTENVAGLGTRVVKGNKKKGILSKLNRR